MSTTLITASPKGIKRENAFGGDGGAADADSVFFQEPDKSLQVQSFTFQKDGEEELATPKEENVSDPHFLSILAKILTLLRETSELSRQVDEIQSQKKRSDASDISNADLFYKGLLNVIEKLEKLFPDFQRWRLKIVVKKIWVALNKELGHEMVKERSEITKFTEDLYKQDDGITFKNKISMSAVAKKEAAPDVSAMLLHQTQILHQILASLNKKKSCLTLDQKERIIASLNKAIPQKLVKGRVEIEIELEKLRLEKKNQEAGNHKATTINEIEMMPRKADELKVSWLTLATMAATTGTAVAVTIAFCLRHNRTS